MNIQLLHGQFSAKDAIDIITQMVHIKIKFQESKISDICTEDDMKMRENKIKRLQQELYDARVYIEQQENVNLESMITIS